MSILKMKQQTHDKLNGDRAKKGRVELNQISWVSSHDLYWESTSEKGLLYPGRDTFEFDQWHVTKNEPITVLIVLSESLAI